MRVTTARNEIHLSRLGEKEIGTVEGQPTLIEADGKPEESFVSSMELPEAHYSVEDIFALKRSGSLDKARELLSDPDTSEGTLDGWTLSSLPRDEGVEFSKSADVAHTKESISAKFYKFGKADRVDLTISRKNEVNWMTTSQTLSAVAYPDSESVPSFTKDQLIAPTIAFVGESISDESGVYHLSPSEPLVLDGPLETSGQLKPLDH